MHLFAMITFCQEHLSIKDLILQMTFKVKCETLAVDMQSYSAGSHLKYHACLGDIC